MAWVPRRGRRAGPLPKVTTAATERAVAAAANEAMARFRVSPLGVATVASATGTATAATSGKGRPKVREAKTCSRVA